MQPLVEKGTGLTRSEAGSCNLLMRLVAITAAAAAAATPAVFATATATAATTATATVVTATATAAATTTTAEGTLFLRARDIDRQRTVVERSAVHGVDRFLGRGGIG